MVDLEVDDRRIPYERVMGSAKTQLLSISKKADSPLVTISLLVDKEKVQVSPTLIHNIIGDALKDIVFGHLFPIPFIASAERTGAAIFRNELNWSRDRYRQQMGSALDIDEGRMLANIYFGYAFPVQENIEFVGRLGTLLKRDSYIYENHSEVLDDFSDILGGVYLVTENDELYYIPKGKSIRLTMSESSSSVRSLLNIGFYLRHVAAPGDLLMVDEPELNLHPENQRRVARLFARLVNVGIKVLITTHSDYIIKELNTLIMLNQEGERFNKIAEHEGYRPAELLDAGKVRVYIAENSTLVPASIDPKMGIEVRSFDTTIEDMNRVQGEIVWGGDE